MGPAAAAAEDEPGPLFGQALPALTFLAFIFFLNFTSRVVFSPLLPMISEELGLSHAESGSFFLCISAGYFVSILLSGHVSSRLNHKRTIVLSTLASGLVLVTLGNCESLFSLRAGLVCLGLAAGLYLPSGLATISRLVAPGYLARGMAVHELAPNIAFVATPLASGLTLAWLSWRQGLEGLGLILCCMGMLYWRYGRGSEEKGSVPYISTLKKVLRLPQFWFMTGLFSMAICSTLGIYAMLPLFLVNGHGMENEVASRLVAVSRITSVIMPVVSGWLGDRFGNRRMMVWVLFLAGLLTVPLGWAAGTVLLVFVVLQPMIAVCFFPSAFAVLSGIGPSGERSVAVSFCIPLAFLLGGGILPTVIGAVGDIFSLGDGLVVAGGMMVLAAVIAGLLMPGCHDGD